MAPWNYIFIYSKEPKEPGALPIELQGLNPGLKSTNKQVIVEHIARYAGTAPSVPAFTYGPLTHLFRLPCNYLS